VQVRRAYGGAVLETWLDVQLSDLAAFARIGREEADESIPLLVPVIADNFGDLKVTEMMLFFQQFKAGRYGRFYGRFEPLTLTAGLQEFRKWRAELAGVLATRSSGR